MAVDEGLRLEVSTLCDEIKRHYSAIWANDPVVNICAQGPLNERPPCFSILEFSPTQKRTMWTYATCCICQPTDAVPIELHLFSPVQTDQHVELLTAIAHYHRTAQPLGVGHTVNFGRPWFGNSACDYGLISLPYLDGPALEQLRSPEMTHIIRCLWLVPITRNERDFKRLQGLEALERRLESSQFDYLDPHRASVV